MGNLTSRAKRTFDEDNKDIISAVRSSKRQKITYNGCSKQSNSDSDKAHHPLNIIMTVWQTIEPFLTLEDTIASSKTCKTLHGTIIDADTRKVKVSRLTIINTRRKTKSEIEQYLPRVMNSIHFPSLQNIRYPPVIVRDRYMPREGIGSTIITCFPMFVAYLSQACNLESLMFDANCMMSYLYNNQSLRNMLSIFSTNLSCCCKLKELRVRISGDVESDEDEVSGAYFSVELLEALLPIIYKRRDYLEVLSIDIHGAPIDKDIGYELGKDLSVMVDFFRAVLLTTKLHDLTLSLSCLPMIALLQTADNGMGSSYVYQFNHLKSLYLKLVDDEISFEVEDQISVNPLLMAFFNCHSLESIELRFQKEFWDDRGSISTLAKLLENKSCLKTLIVDFNKFDDQEKVLQLLTDFADDCKSNKYPRLKAIELESIKLDRRSCLIRSNSITSPLVQFDNVLSSIPGSTRGITTTLGGELYNFERYVD